MFSGSDWLLAHKGGSLKHSWAPIRIEQAGHVLELEVSADAAAVGGVRQSISARDQQLLADELGAVLLTARLYEERHRHARIRIEPRVAGLVEPGGTVTSVTAAEHSAAVSLAIGKTECVVLVDNVGKTWIVDILSSPTEAINYGWLVPREHWGGTWRGISVHAPLWLDKAAWQLIQRQPDKKNRHGLTHADYSQVALFARDACVLDRKPDSLARIYAHPTLCVLVTHDGKPVPARQPGVPRANARPASAAAPPFSRPGDPEEKVLAWQLWLIENGYPLPRYGADGIHGAAGETERATQAALVDHPELLPAADTDPPPPPSWLPIPEAPFRHAKHYYPARKEGTPIWVIIHTAEGLPDLVGDDLGAENLQKYGLNPTRRKEIKNTDGTTSSKIVPVQVSWHAAGDSDSIARSVLDAEVAFAAPGANARGLQFELCTRAGKADWTDAYHQRMLDLAARQVALWCHTWNIPARKVGPAEMLRGEPGIAGHQDVTRGVGKGKTNHVDPERAFGVQTFPWDSFIAAVRRYLAVLAAA